MRESIHASTLSAIEAGVTLCLTLCVLRSLLWLGRVKTFRRSHSNITYWVSPHADSTWNGFLRRVFPRSSHAGDEWFVTRDDVDEKVELVGLAERLCDVRARQRASFVGIGDYERPCGDLCNENFFDTAKISEPEFGGMGENS